ncbi:MAG: rod shape-determining protein RodA [Acidobacteriota bacterium]|jgi:rod shape determining protein RodA
MFKTVRKDLHHVDWLAFGAAVALMIIGAVMVQSATFQTRFAFLAGRQVMFDLIALAVLGLAVFIPYEIWLEYSYILYGAVLVVLLLLPLVGHSVAGSRSWLVIGPISVQPSELAKFFGALACAGYIKGLEPRKIGRTQIAVMLGIVLVPMGLTFLQPDFGTATTFLPILAAVFYVSDVPLGKLLKWAALGFAGLLVLFALGWFTFFKPYQKERILTFLNPSLDPQGAGYQVNQAKIAVGSGEFWGKGLHSGTQNRLNFLPAPQTDFIFGVVAEETGFAGSLILLGLYTLLLLRLTGAMELARDREGRFLAVAAFAVLLYHVIINVGMVLGLLPTTGIPLPFLSYGGSSLLSMTLFVGLAINVRTHRFSL